MTLNELQDYNRYAQMNESIKRIINVLTTKIKLNRKNITKTTVP